MVVCVTIFNLSFLLCVYFFKSSHVVNSLTRQKLTKL